MPARRDVIRSAKNPLVQRFRRLSRSAASEPEVALVEGPRLLMEALDCGVEVLEVAATETALQTPDSWPARIPAERTRRMSERVLEGMSALQATQGVAAIVARPRFEWTQIYGACPLVLVAVSVQEPGNLGGMIRTALGAGATGAVLAGECADVFSWKALRGSMGGAFRLPHVRARSAGEALSRLRQRGVGLVAAVPGAERDYTRVDWREPQALVVGSEGRGLPAKLTATCDEQVSIPMAPGAASLNVGVAAGVALFEAARQRGGASRHRR